MDIQLKAYASFLAKLPTLLSHLGNITVDAQPCIFDASGKRHVSEQECVARGLTYALTIINKDTMEVVMQIPIMLPNGTFLVKGQYRVIVLRQVRAAVPIVTGNCIATRKGKIFRGRFIPSYTTDSISFAEAESKFGVSNDMLKFFSSSTFVPFDALHADHMRILTCKELLIMLVENCSRSIARFGKWKEQMATAAIFSCMATGNWKGTAMKGVTQLANRSSQYALRCQMSVVINASTRQAARYVHPSTCGLFCVSDTPEGQSVGLTHTLVDGVKLSEHIDIVPDDVGFSPDARGAISVFLNGEWKGRHTGTPQPMHGVRVDMRSDTEAWIWSDAGRMYRDEFTPEMIVAQTARQIPFMPHNQTPRVSYYCNMCKQAMVCEEALGTGHKLLYAQKPAIQPCHDNSAGINVILAVNAMAWNQEDALVFAKGAIDRGLFRSVEHKEHVVKGGGSHEQLDDDGLVSCGMQMQPGQVIAVEEETQRPYKIPPRGAPNVLVTQVVTAPNENRATVTTVGMRQPEIGDKFVSRFGQKGVIGAIVPDEDMPFTKDGIRPDVVINPHAWPSRMTVGQIMEAAGAKINIISGKNMVDGRPWHESHTVQQLADELKALKQAPSGKERMYCGITGCMLPEPIFIAPCWYQRLTHLAREKCYARPANGPTNMATLQPTKGRKQAGGIRLGEMERDVLLSNGAMGVLSERNASAGRVNHNGMLMPPASKLLLQELNAMCISTTVDTI